MEPLSSDIIQWIADHAAADVATLRLRHHSDRTLMHAILQIEARRKTASKLADTLKCPSFQFPDMIAAEQSTSDALAAIHSSIIGEAATVADLTCGLGIDTFHFAASGRKVTAIERRPEAAEAARLNARALGLAGSVEVITADSTENLKGIYEKAYKNGWCGVMEWASNNVAAHAENWDDIAEATKNIEALIPERVFPLGK